MSLFDIKSRLLTQKLTSNIVGYDGRLASGKKIRAYESLVMAKSSDRLISYLSFLNDSEEIVHVVYHGLLIISAWEIPLPIFLAAGIYGGFVAISEADDFNDIYERIIIM